jgi:phytol kinase
LSYTFNIFKSVHLARRYGTGEYLSAISIALVAIITHDHLLFAAAVLHLSLADGIAAVIGTRFGKGNIYHIFGQRKSLIGTSTFWLCSVIILAIVFSVGHISGIWPALLWLPLVATALENIGIYGTDNLLVPVAVVLILRALI